jgi:hypothetical protein
MSTIHVSSYPEGSECHIDGIQRGNTPLSLQLPQGNHDLSISRTNYYTFTSSLKLESDILNIKTSLQKQYPNRATGFVLNLIYPGSGNTYLTGNKGYLWIGAAFYGLLIPGLINFDNDNAIIAMPALLYYLFINPTIAFLPNKSKFRSLPKKY